MIAQVRNEAALADLQAARRMTDELFEMIHPDHLYARPIPERHRLIFYVGHLEAFDWNLISRKTLDLPSFHPAFDQLFEFGIDPPEGQSPQDAPADWPSVREIHGYRARTRERLDALWEDLSADRRHVLLEHRLMHAETLAYLLHNLPYEGKIAPSAPAPFRGDSPSLEMIGVPAGSATLGQAGGEFGWDNEFDRHTVDVPSFRLSRFKVTNGDYLQWVKESGAPAPHFWLQRDGEWFYRGMFAEQPLPLSCPVYVTHAEAAAYAGAHGAALLTEAQFHRAAKVPAIGNFDFRHWDPIPVDAGSEPGIAQLVGNGWEWTSTVFGPFPGFEPFSYYPGYSKNFFDEEHFVLKGASPRTAACFLRPSFRNWFRPRYPHVYATFRLVENQ